MGSGADAVMTSTICSECRKMHKNVLAALTVDEAVCIIEPLYCFHVFVLFYLSTRHLSGYRVISIVLQHRASRDCGSGGAGNFVVSRGILQLACNCLEYEPRQCR